MRKRPKSKYRQYRSSCVRETYRNKMVIFLVLIDRINDRSLSLSLFRPIGREGSTCSAWPCPLERLHSPTHTDTQMKHSHYKLTLQKFNIFSKYCFLT